MKLRDFIKIVCSTTIVELRSLRTEEVIKQCAYKDLTEEDMELTIDNMIASVYYNESYKAWLGLTVLYVY